MECEKGIAGVPSRQTNHDACTIRCMNLGKVFSLRMKSVVGMTVLATVSLRAFFACPGLKAYRLTIEWE